MNAPPLKGTKLICANKRRYPDEVTARASGMFSIAVHGNVSKLHAYKCPECRGWHLSKRNRGSVAITQHDPVAVRLKDVKVRT